MRLLIVTPYYAPDLGPSAPLIAMLAEDLAALGHAVTALAAAPHFPTGRVALEHRGRAWRWSDEGGVRVGRVWVPSGDRANLRHRLATFGVFQALACLAGLRLAYDAVLITNPAIETGLAFAVLAWLKRKPAIFSVWDLYPDIGVRLGIFRARGVAGLVGALENFCLRRAAVVQALAESFVAPLAARGVEAGRIAVILPWLDTDFVRPLPRRNAFAREHGLEDCFVLLYAGNLGLSQGLEHALAAAGQLAAQPNFRLVLVGDGPARAQLAEQAAALGLANAQFIPFQPRERLPEVLASADIALVSLRPGAAADSLPSKIFPLLASGRPILAAVDEGSAAWNLVEQTGAGVGVPPADPSRLAEAALRLEQNPALRQQMGAAGREYAVARFARRGAARQFEALFRQVAQAGGENQWAPV